MVVLKGFSPNEFVEWEDSHPLCSNALSLSGSVMITITITITTYGHLCFQQIAHPPLKIVAKTASIVDG